MSFNHTWERSEQFSKTCAMAAMSSSVTVDSLPTSAFFQTWTVLSINKSETFHHWKYFICDVLNCKRIVGGQKTGLSLVYPSLNYLKGRKDLKVSYCVINILTGEIDELKSICLIFAKEIPKRYSVQDSLRGNSSVRWGTWANAGCPRNWNYDSIRGKYIKYSITESWRVVTKTDLWTRPVNPEDFSGLPGLVPNKSNMNNPLIWVVVITLFFRQSNHFLNVLGIVWTDEK